MSGSANNPQGSLSVAVVDGALPANQWAIVLLGQVSPLDRLIVVSASQFTDQIYLRAMGEAYMYQQTHPTDRGRVTIRLFSDGRKEIQSDMNGTSEGIHVPRGERYSGTNVMATEILGRAAKTALTTVPGIGPARVVTLTP